MTEDKGKSVAYTHAELFEAMVPHGGRSNAA